MVRGGHLIKLARKARGMTQEQVSSALGCDVKEISRWENFKHEPSFTNVYMIITDICKLDFVTVEELAFENNQRRSA